MIGWVYAMKPADYQAWLSGGTAGETLAAAGAKRFQEQACNTCHGEEKGARGPTLVGIYGKPVRLQSGQTVLTDEAYLRESITNPQAQLVEGYPPIMPTFQGLISEEGLLQLVAYIKSLSPAPTGAALPPRPPSPRKGSRQSHEHRRRHADPAVRAPRQLPERPLRREVVAADASTTSGSRSST